MDTRKPWSHLINYWRGKGTYAKPARSWHQWEQIDLKKVSDCVQNSMISLQEIPCRNDICIWLLKEGCLQIGWGGGGGGGIGGICQWLWLYGLARMFLQSLLIVNSCYTRKAKETIIKNNKHSLDKEQNTLLPLIKGMPTYCLSQTTYVADQQWSTHHLYHVICCYGNWTVSHGDAASHDPGNDIKNDY